MSRIPIQKTDILHCLNRGVLKQNIFESDADRWHFLEVLRYKNHDANIQFWQNDIYPIAEGHDLLWPKVWDAQDPLVRIDAYILMDNHYHLILTEIRENGISAFMKKLSNTYTGYYQNKYNWEERLFTGTYKSVHVLSNHQLRKLFVYVLIKNSFERHPEGMEWAIDNFDKAFDWSRRYSFSSIGEVTEDRKPFISSNKLFSEIFESAQGFKQFSHEQMKRYQVFLQEVDNVNLE
jgi:REP element-mobilizing transposase RayT